MNRHRITLHEISRIMEKKPELRLRLLTAQYRADRKPDIDLYMKLNLIRCWVAVIGTTGYEPAILEFQEMYDEFLHLLGDIREQ